MVPREKQKKDIKALQSLVEASSAKASAKPASKKKKLSRAARLQLIDILSRQADTGLALIAGSSIYLSIVVGRSEPVRAITWVAMVLCTMWFARRLQSQYRAGVSTTSRPFRWRTTYTAALSVLGVTFSSAVILLAPANGSISPLHVGSVVFAASLTGALLHSAHLSAAFSLLLPTSVFLVLKTATTGPSPMLWALVAITLGLASVTGLHRRLCETARRSNPWTRFVRREIATPDLQRHPEETIRTNRQIPNV